MMRPNSRTRDVHKPVSGDHRYSSSKHELASSACFSDSQVIWREDNLGEVGQGNVVHPDVFANRIASFAGFLSDWINSL